MSKIDTWDWTVGREVVADVARICSDHGEIHERTVSPDGKQIALLVKGADASFTAIVNGDPWPVSFEKLWYLRYTAGGKLYGLCMDDDEWTVVENGTPWEEKFEFVWEPKVAADGMTIGCMAKSDMAYRIALAGKAWEKGYPAIREFALSPDGTKAAASVMVEQVREGDINAFRNGPFSVVVNGEAWESRFMGAWNPLFSADGKHVAAEVRTDIAAYTVAEDGQTWDAKFGGVWEVAYRGKTGVLAPVRTEGNWTLAEDGRLIWSRMYPMLWRPVVSFDGQHIAAIAAPEMGRWTIVVDDQPWASRFSDMVAEPTFSPDGRRVAALVKSKNRWSVAVDGEPWSQDFEMVWTPVLSGHHVCAVVEKAGRYGLCMNGHMVTDGFEWMWNPIFSPDGKQVLLRYLENGKYIRDVRSTDSL